MNELILKTQRARFGQSREKISYVMKDANLFFLINETEVDQDPRTPNPTERRLLWLQPYARKKTRTIDELTAELPVEKVVLELSENQQMCDKCGKKFVLIGKKLVSQQLVIITGSVRQ